MPYYHHTLSLTDSVNEITTFFIYISVENIVWPNIGSSDFDHLFIPYLWINDVLSIK